MPMNSKKTAKNITDNVFMIFPKRSFIMLHFYLYNQLLQWFRNFWAIEHLGPFIIDIHSAQAVSVKSARL